MPINFCMRGVFAASLIISLNTVANAQTWEIYDHNFKMTQRIENDNIKVLSETVRVSANGSGLQLLNQEYKPFYSLKGDKIYQFLEPWIIVSKGDKFGAYHEYGEEIFAVEFDEITTYYTKLLGRKGNAYFLYDRGLRKTKPLGAFENAYFADNGQIIAKTSAGYFLPLSERPNKIYQHLEVISDKNILSRESSGIGLINRDGNYILDPVVDELRHIEGDYFYGLEGNQHMLLKALENKADIKYSSFHRISVENDMIVEFIHGKLRRIMKNDGILLDIVGMDSVKRQGPEHYNIFFRDKKLGLLNAQGKWDVVPSENIQMLYPGNDGLYGAKIDGRYGFVDRSGKLRIANRYDQIGKYSEGLAAIKIDNKWGFLDAYDRISIQPQYEDVGEFFRGIAIVKKNGKANLIDKNGKELLNNFYERISLTEDNYYMTEENDKFGLVNAYGNEISIPKFDELRRETNDQILIRRGDKYGVMSESGEYSLPIYYRSILFDKSNERVLAEDEYIPVILETVVEDNKKKSKKGV